MAQEIKHHTWKSFRLHGVLNTLSSYEIAVYITILVLVYEKFKTTKYWEVHGSECKPLVHRSQTFRARRKFRNHLSHVSAFSISFNLADAHNSVGGFGHMCCNGLDNCTSLISVATKLFQRSELERICWVPIHAMCPNPFQLPLMHSNGYQLLTLEGTHGRGEMISTVE